MGKKKVTLKGKNISAAGTSKKILAKKTLLNKKNISQSLYDNITIGIYRTSPRGKILLANSALVKMLGYSSFKELRGRNLLKKEFEPSYPRSFFIEKMKNDGEILDLKSAWKKQDGSTIYVNENARVVRDSKGKVLYYDGTVEDITERKRAEEALLESEKMFRELWGATVEGITILDKGIIVEVNDAMCRMLGYKREQAIGKSLLDFAPAEMHERISKRIAINSEEPFETPTLRVDGTKIIFEVFAKQILFHNKSVRMVTTRDITERKQAEEALRKNEELLRSSVRIANIGIFDHDQQNDTIYWSPRQREIHGWGLEEPVDLKSFLCLVHPEDSERIALTVQRAHDPAGDGLWDVEHRIIRRDGSMRWLAARSQTFFDGEGSVRRPVRTIGAVLDITERKESEEALRVSENKFRSIFENSTIGIALVGLDAKYLMVNPALCKIYGYSAEELLKLTFLDITHPDDLEISSKKKNDVEDGKGKGILFTKRYVHKDGHTIWTEVSSASINDSKGNPLYFITHVTDLTERRRTEEEIRMLSAGVEQSSEGMAISNLDGNLIFINDAWCKMHGYESSKGLIGKSLEIFHNKEQMENEVNPCNKHVIEHGVFSGEIGHITKDGKLFPTLMSTTLLKNEQGQPYAFVGIAKDITERTQAEEALRESEERFKMLFENVFDGISLYNEDPDPSNRRLIECNERYATMAGRSRDELLRLGSIFGLQTNFNDQAEQDRLEFLEKGKSFLGSFSWIRPDGKENVVEYVGTPITWRGKSYTIGIDRDVTDRKRAEDELRKLSQAVKQSPASIIITNSAGRIEYANPKSLEITGYQSSELIGKNPKIFSSGERPKNEYIELWETISSGKEWRGEFHNKKKNGELFWESASISPIINGENEITHYLAVKEDITERKRAEKELIEAKEKAEQSDKLKSEFLAQMSHEIRTPINAILGNIGFLDESLGDKVNADARDCFYGIDLASKRIIRTVDLILNVAELQTTGYKPQFIKINLDSDVLKILYLEHQLSAQQKGLELIYTCCEKDTFVIADEYSITQIFANLMDNAIKYTKKGKVEILLTKNSKDNIIVEIKDTGIGMNKEFLSRIFEPFVQEERGFTRSYDGNGLGLALVKRYCEINNATIEIESEKDLGSTFRVTFHVG